VTPEHQALLAAFFSVISESTDLSGHQCDALARSLLPLAREYAAGEVELRARSVPWPWPPRKPAVRRETA